MARKTNEAKAREVCALHNVAVDYEPGNGVELWGRDTHTSTDKGTHSDYFPRENYRSDAAMWADVAIVAATFKPCADDCECRAMTICGVCGNAGNVADFMETHDCVNPPVIYNVEYSDECGNHSTVAHVGLKSVADTISNMGDTDDTIGFNGENLTCNNVPEQWTDSEYGYEYVTICGRYPHPSGDTGRVTLFTIVVTRPANSN